MFIFNEMRCYIQDLFLLGKLEHGIYRQEKKNISSIMSNGNPDLLGTSDTDSNYDFDEWSGISSGEGDDNVRGEAHPLEMVSFPLTIIIKFSFRS